LEEDEKMNYRWTDWVRVGERVGKRVESKMERREKIRGTKSKREGQSERIRCDIERSFNDA